MDLKHELHIRYITQVEVAKAANCSAAWVHYVLTGKKRSDKVEKAAIKLIKKYDSNKLKLVSKSLLTGVA